MAADNISLIENHTQEAKAYLLEQYTNRPNIEGLLTALLYPLQDIENEAFFMYQNFSIYTATNYYLDRIGTVLGELRQYRNDSDYRLALFTKVAINNNGSTAEEIITILAEIYSAKVSYREYGNAMFQVYLTCEYYPSGINELLNRIKPACVLLPVVLHSTDNNVFYFSEISNEIDNLALKEVNTQSEYVISSNTELHVSFDHPVNIYDSLGFGELRVTKTNLMLGNQSKYYVSNNTPLEMLLDYGDFVVEGGSKFIEVIKYG